MLAILIEEILFLIQFCISSLSVAVLKMPSPRQCIEEKVYLDLQLER